MQALTHRKKTIPGSVIPNLIWNPRTGHEAKNHSLTLLWLAYGFQLSLE
jgi:hypothetical protein